jgi:crotonobetainyl-CoA:carnitine CoA-transferase CaiB-like acyl-CoA transferase
MASDARFASVADRKAQEHILEDLVAGWMRTEDGPALVERLQCAGVPAGMVQDGRDLLDDLHLRARGFYVTLTHPRAGAFPHEGVVAQLSDTPGGVRAPAPCLGEHTDEVLGRLLGLDFVAIERYRNAGILE